jgi:hypothetical protein
MLLNICICRVVLKNMSHTNPSYFVDTMNLTSNHNIHRQAERSFTDEISCIFHEHFLPCLITKNDTCGIPMKFLDALIN